MKTAADRFLPGDVVKSVSEYLSYIEKTCTDFSGVLFRGHRLETWSLLPKLARLKWRDGYDVLDAEKAMMEEFKRRALPHLAFRPSTPWEWLAIAQHHGMATRLLDWTSNPLAAIWFAVEHPSREDTRATVWMFFAMDKDYVTDPERESPFDTDRTRVFRPSHLTPRIVAQNGWFTVHRYMPKGKRFVPFEANRAYENRLGRIAVPREAFSTIRRELDRCGINQASLYADLDGLARFAEWKFSPLADELDA